MVREDLGRESLGRDLEVRNGVGEQAGGEGLVGEKELGTPQSSGRIGHAGNGAI